MRDKHFQYVNYNSSQLSPLTPPKPQITSLTHKSPQFK